MVTEKSTVNKIILEASWDDFVTLAVPKWDKNLFLQELLDVTTLFWYIRTDTLFHHGRRTGCKKMGKLSSEYTDCCSLIFYGVVPKTHLSISRLPLVERLTFLSRSNIIICFSVVILNP